VVFGQHVHPILIPVIFFSGLFEGQSLQPNAKMEGPKANICWKTANIPAEQLQRVNQNLFHWRKKCLHVEGQHLQQLL
jgi:hypothetical protein